MQSSMRPPPRPKGPAWPRPPHTALFVRNLRLLDLDTHEDWPDITVETFSPSPVNSKRRIQAVEWALYHLFRMWDPIETNNKLRPFFPPLESLQSVNLRAALFRVLSDLKKNGDLGREAILRKTMLDDCKGEKFEELLALFSTAVLRRVLSSRKSAPDTVAMRIATSSRPTASEQEVLLPLILAHRSSVVTLMKERKQLGESYDGYDKLFRATLEEVTERAKGVTKPTKQEADAFDQVRRDIKNSWQGVGAWADTILEGGSTVTTNPFLEADFPHAWSVVRKGGDLSDIQTTESIDLLADLDGRITQQQTRLRRWKEFRKSLATEKKSAGAEGPPKQVPAPLLFRQHQGLSMPGKKDDRGATIQVDEYRRFITDMEHALGSIQGYTLPSIEPPSPLTWARQASPRHSVQRAALDTPSVRSPTSRERPSPRIVLPRNTWDHPLDQDLIDLPSPMHNIRRSDTPSVVIEPDPQEEDPEDNHIASPLANQFDQESEGISNLTERTRKSMSLLPAPTTTKPRHSLVKKSRQSQTFPVNQFETPRKAGQAQRAGAVTPQGDLFSQDADYASVFKSRPKIATSPVNTPPVHVPAFDDADDAYDEDEDPTQDLVIPSSPLVGRQNRRF